MYFFGLFATKNDAIISVPMEIVLSNYTDFWVGNPPKHDFFFFSFWSVFKHTEEKDFFLFLHYKNQRNILKQITGYVSPK